MNLRKFLTTCLWYGHEPDKSDYDGIPVKGAHCLHCGKELNP